MVGAIRYDVAVVGAGHNGLVCACYLARAGLRVIVLERRDIVGGAAVTEEFHPGFRNSTLAYTVSLLHPKIIRDLNLVAHGLRVVERPFANFLPLSASESIRVGGGIESTQAELARFSTRDAQRLPDYYSMLDRVAAVLRDLLLETPPNVGGGLHDLFQTWKVGKRFKRLDTAARRDVLDIFTMSAGDLLDRWFECDAIKACFGFDAVVGNFASPYAPGSAYVLLHHVFGEVNGKPGIWGHAIGGMGAITEAMAIEARAHGVEIRTRAGVTRIVARGGQPLKLVLESGEEMAAGCVAAGVNPRLLMTCLLDTDQDLGDDKTRFADYQCESASMRINVALSELPDFSCLPGKHAQAHHRSGIIVAPSLAYMERAYADARETGWSRSPIVEVLIPSTVDDSLAPSGKHVASLFCQHFRYCLPNGRSWDDEKDAAADAAIAVVNRVAPNFSASIMARNVHSPLDLERKFGMTGGDIFHGKLTLNQLFSARPILGNANYRMPVKGLYLCGAGAHPGGGVTGIPGHNAAREILRDR